MSDYAFGVYLIQVWAGISGADPQQAVSDFKSKNSSDAITALGNVFNTQHLSIDSAKAQFQKLIDDGAGDIPTLADLNAAILAVAGTPPSSWSIVKDALAETGKQIEAGASIAFTGLKWLTVLAGIGLAVYIGWESGAFRAMAKNRA